MPSALFQTFLIVAILGIKESTSSDASLTCKSGAVFVVCDWQRCKNETWPSRLVAEHPHVQLFQRESLLATSKELKYAKFTVNLQYLPPKRWLEFSCVWRNSKEELCHYNVTVDRFAAPLPPQNVSFSFYTNDNMTFEFKVVKVKFRVSLVEKSVVAEQLASVYVMKMGTRHCPVKIEDAQTSETKVCPNGGNEIICPNMLSWNDAGFSRVYAVIATTKNAIGICHSQILCKRVTFSEIYGNIQDVRVTNDVKKGAAEFNVSWRYPQGLKYAVNKLNVAIRYCETNGACYFKNITNLFIEEPTTFSLVSKQVKYNTSYKIQLCYIIDYGFFPNVSPWTKAVKIITLKRIPRKTKITRCSETDRQFYLQWKDDPKHVSYYWIRIEASNQKDRYLLYPTNNCTQNVCSLVVRRPSIEKSFRFTLSSCSNSGCNDVDVSYCTFKASSAASQFMNEISDGNMMLIVTIALLAFVFALVVALIVFRVLWKKRTQEGNIFIVKPRQKDDSDQDNILAEIRPYENLY